MSRVRSIFHFTVATGVKILSSLLVVKFLAWQLGPEGFGLLSQLMAFAAIASMLAGGGITNGVIKVLSVTPSHTREGKDWLGNALTITIVFSMGLGVLWVANRDLLSDALFQGQFSSTLVWIAIAQVGAGIGSLILAEASSRGNSHTYVKIVVAASLMGAMAVIAGVSFQGLNGAAYAIVISPAMTGIFGFVILVRQQSPVIRVAPQLDWGKVRHLMSYASLTLVGALSVPLAQILVRENFGQLFSWESVGFWQGVVKISDVYMQFVGVILINYGLPRFSGSDLRKARAELTSILMWLLLLLVVGFSLLLAVRDFVVQLVFSEAFLPMGKYFLFQMAGDLLRTIAASFSFFFLARGQVRVPLAFEFAQGVVFYVIYLLVREATGEMAPVYAHVVTYLLLACLMAWRIICSFRTNRF